jgi:hypothetical protein
MNRKSILISSLALAVLSAALTAVPSASEQAQLAAHSRLATRVIESQILSHFPDPSGERERIGDMISRSGFRYRVKSQYTMALVEHAPEGMNATATRFPFEIYDQPAYAKAAPPVLFFGYYDASTRTLHVYLAAEFKYVAATEHPLIKAAQARPPLGRSTSAPSPANSQAFAVPQ